MSKILAVATHGTDDPTKATMPFITAIGAIGAEKPLAIALLGEAALLAKQEVAASVKGVGFPPLSELVPQIREAKIEVFV